MILQIQHATTLSYSEPVSETVLEVRMAPLSDEEQTTLGYRLAITPPAPVTAYRDGFGNRVELFNLATPYQELSVLATSYVRTDRRPGVHKLAAIGFDPEREVPIEVLDYLRPTTLVDRSEALDQFLETLTPLPGTLGEVVDRIARAVRSRLSYEKQVTTSKTRLSEALALGRGVCQDYTHLFLGACRGLGLPARYVSGYLHAPGELETHAWSQVWGGPVGWVDVDPTHIDDTGNAYVAIAVGRDYDDVPPNRGVWKGRATETIRVVVTIEEVDRVPFDWQTWASPSPWLDPPALGFHQVQRQSSGGAAFGFQRQSRTNLAGRRASYRGSYRHQQGQQQQSTARPTFPDPIPLARPRPFRYPDGPQPLAPKPGREIGEPWTGRR